VIALPSVRGVAIFVLPGKFIFEPICCGSFPGRSEHWAWSMEHGAWSMEHGAWSSVGQLFFVVLTYQKTKDPSPCKASCLPTGPLRLESLVSVSIVNCQSDTALVRRNQCPRDDPSLGFRLSQGPRGPRGDRLLVVI
jgi:hypothetical protein